MTSASGPPRRRGAARWVLATLLAAMAAAQLSDLQGFIDIVATYRVGSGAVAGALGAALITGEIAGAVGLWGGPPRRQAGTVALAVAVGWSVLGAQAFARGIAVDNCGCFGVHAGQQLRWWVLIEDLEFIALAWWVRGRGAAPATVAASGGEGPDRVTVS